MALGHDVGEIFYPDFDLGAFRYAVARYVKLLIRARWRCEPGFLADDDLAQWQLRDIEDDSYPAWRLLSEAAEALAKLNTEFLPRCGSGGVRITDEATAVGRLISNVAGLAETGGGGPYHNGELLLAAATLRKKSEADWASLVQWSLLREIRSDLDKLPHPQRQVGSGQPFPRSTSSTDDRLPRNVLCRLGNDWNVRYDGGQLFALVDSPGLFYINYLLERPGESCHVTELDLAWARSQVTLRSGTGGQTTEADAANEGVRFDGGLDDGLVLDQEGKTRCKEEFDRIRRELHQAEAQNDQARISMLNEEKRQLAFAVTAASKPGGRGKKVGDKLKKQLDRVCKAISRSIQKIGLKDVDLERHFLASLHTGYLCTYSPDRPTPWNQ